jgi:uncharacterized protein GlcG (DUF336 family)
MNSCNSVRALWWPALAAGLVLAACSDDDVTSPSGPQTFTPNPIVTLSQLQTALTTALVGGNGGLDFPMWATVVDRAGVVVAVAYSGAAVDDQWLGSRAISAQKANTANDFSLDAFPLSTANLYSAVQPGGSLYGLQLSNPVDPAVVYGGDQAQYGTVNDYMVGKKPGGINVFGGGLALYDVTTGEVIGAVGLSGDTSCADHNIAWRVRDALNMDKVPGGVAPGVGANPPGNTDNIIFDITAGVSAGGFGHPTCLGGAADSTLGTNNPGTYPITP